MSSFIRGLFSTQNAPKLPDSLAGYKGQSPQEERGREMNESRWRGREGEGRLRERE